MPSTSSSTTSVKSPTHRVGSKRNSISSNRAALESAAEVPKTQKIFITKIQKNHDFGCLG